MIISQETQVQLSVTLEDLRVIKKLSGEVTFAQMEEAGLTSDEIDMTQAIHENILEALR